MIGADDSKTRCFWPERLAAICEAAETSIHRPPGCVRRRVTDRKQSWRLSGPQRPVAAERLTLERCQLTDPLLGEPHERIELAAREGSPFAGPLHFD
jgi:hypothetical protein